MFTKKQKTKMVSVSVKNDNDYGFHSEMIEVPVTKKRPDLATKIINNYFNAQVLVVGVWIVLGIVFSITVIFALIISIF